MKILVPVDFSKTSENAIRYAVNFAKGTASEIIFFNSSHIPVIAPGKPIKQDESLVKKADGERKNLINLANKLCKDAGFGKTRYTCVTGIGFASEEIPGIVENEKCDLIIMGTTGADGLKKLFGSVTYHIIKMNLCPLIAVPKNFNPEVMPKKIILAIDYKNIFMNIMPLEEINQVFGSEFFIFNVRNKKNLAANSDEMQKGLIFEDRIKKLKHSYHYSVGENIPEALQGFVQKVDGNLLVIFPHEKDFIESLFGISTTKELTHTATTPLLIIPDIDEKRGKK